ncbi:hypothetical protein C9I98_08915 [Photobacterium sanctipauli]|uniref:Uncharacterized protein n=1 Tax=Photobacterium sanctipauli TaxID=1342794 RepID=A0A2T3NV80_9GAMM|nr:hypothetical protein [Photobacterium sanctipauli]PSW20167.1 hypothetical protein C9I98_08915 [Photobacterium sanctipauli]
MSFSDNFNQLHFDMIIRSDKLGLQWGSNNVGYHGMGLAEIKADIQTWYPTRRSGTYRSRMKSLLDAKDLVLVCNR